MFAAQGRPERLGAIRDGLPRLKCLPGAMAERHASKPDCRASRAAGGCAPLVSTGPTTGLAVGSSGADVRPPALPAHCGLQATGSIGPLVRFSKRPVGIKCKIHVARHGLSPGAPPVTTTHHRCCHWSTRGAPVAVMIAAEPAGRILTASPRVPLVHWWVFVLTLCDPNVTCMFRR